MDDLNSLTNKLRQCADDYAMLSPGDAVAVDVSGGKDSLVLLCALAALRRYYPAPFTLEAVTVDAGFPAMDFSGVAALCRELEVPYTVVPTDIREIVFEARQESNPCSLCARMRRGILHDMTKAAGCNKLALGHHMDDAAETFMMNLLSGGTIGSFRPVTYLSRKDLTVIRPMIFATEKEVASAARRENLPIVKSPCPMDKTSERQKVKELIAALEKDYPNLRGKITGAMQRGNISGW